MHWDVWSREEQQGLLDYIDQEITHLFMSKATKVLGEKRHPRSDHMLVISEELVNAQRERRKAFKVWRKRPTEEAKTAYIEANNELLKLISASQKRRQRGVGSLLGCNAESLESYRQYLESSFLTSLSIASMLRRHAPVELAAMIYQWFQLIWHSGMVPKS